MLYDKCFIISDLAQDEATLHEETESQVHFLFVMFLPKLIDLILVAAVMICYSMNCCSKFNAMGSKPLKTI